MTGISRSASHASSRVPSRVPSPAFSRPTSPASSRSSTYGVAPYNTVEVTPDFEYVSYTASQIVGMVEEGLRKSAPDRAEPRKDDRSRRSVFVATYQNARNSETSRPWALGFDPEASDTMDPPASHVEIAKRFAERVPFHFAPCTCNQRPGRGQAAGRDTLASEDHPCVTVIDRPLDRDDVREGDQVWFGVEEPWS